VKRPCFLLLSVLCAACVSPTEGPVPTDAGQTPAEAAAPSDGAAGGDTLSIVSPGTEAGTDTAGVVTDAPVDLVTADASVDLAPPDPPPLGCHPGDKRCEPAQTPSTCTAAGVWMASDPCPAVCSGPGECTGVCKPGTRRCAGANNLTPQTCDDHGQWTDGPACANLCSSGSCGGSCPPGNKRCGANQVVETCSPAGTWEPGAACQFVCTGQGICGGSCKPGSRRCGSAAVQICGADGSTFADSQPCPLGCDPSTIACIACKPRAESCSNGIDDDCDGKVDCADPDCTKGTSCGTDKVCSGGACVGCRAGKSCLDEPCRTGTFDCSTGVEVCKITNKKDGSACGSAASCGGTATHEADACNSALCMAGKVCDYHGCDAAHKCTTVCPASTNDTGLTCDPCGLRDQPCCDAGGGTCAPGKLRCTAAHLCRPCGGEDQQCCQVATGTGCDNPDDLCVAEFGDVGIGVCSIPR
jgi:hypothetical protein